MQMLRARMSSDRFLAMLAVLWLFRRGNPSRLNRGFRRAQRVAAFAMALGHGMQDAAKTMGIVVLALYTGGFQDTKTNIPWWVFWTSATVLALGTYSGGWRIIRTLGRRIIKMDPPRGFAVDVTAAAVLMFAAQNASAPVSTTHVISSTVMGVGSTDGLSAVRWGVARSIVAFGSITLPGNADPAAKENELDKVAQDVLSFLAKQ